jgi:hypothetical protein
MNKYYLEYNLKMNITEKIIINQTEKLINIRGTYGLPLFNSKDIENALELKNIRNLFKKVEDEDKKYLEIETNSGIQKTLFLTYDGVSEILRHTRSHNRENLIEFVVNIFVSFQKIDTYNELKEKGIVNEFTISYETKLKLKEMNKINNEFYEKMKDKEVIFVSKTGECEDDTRYKHIYIGSSSDLKKTNEELIKENGESTLLYVFESLFCKEFENFLIFHKELFKYKVNKPETNGISHNLFTLREKSYYKILQLIHNNILKKN